MSNLIANLLFEHLDKFQAYSSSVCEKVERTFANKMGILLQFKRLFHDQSCLFVIVIHVQLYSFMFNIHKNRPKKKTGRINLINTWLVILHKQHIQKIKHNSPC